MSRGSPALKREVLSLAFIPEHDLLHPIASGAYGQVWLARNRLGVYRAVKIVHRASFDHDRPFEREFAGIKAFEPVSRSHEGLVDLLQVGRDDAAGYFYYVMELADDLNGKLPSQSAADTPALDSYAPRTLAAEVKRRGRLPLDECIRIGLSLAEALLHLHRQGLVHRDIKPSNVIFVDGVAKLADVGLVAAVADARSFVGTEGFIAPEGPGTAQADLYSLGIVLYVLSTGKSHQDFPEPPADLSAQENHAQWLEFDAVVHKACQARVSDRYQSAEELRDELALLQRGESVKDKRAVQRRWRVSRRIALAVIALALLPMPFGLLKQSSHSYTPKPEAARLYEQGRWYYSQLTPADHAKALDYLSRSVQVDPSFVDPYGELTGVYIWSMLTGIADHQQRLQKASEIANKVLALNPNRAEGHAALSLYNFLRRDWHGAETEIVRAIQLNPNLPIPHQFYSYYLTMQGRTAEAHRESQRAEELSSPQAARVSAIVGAWPFVAERRFDRAIAQLQRAIDLDRNFAYGHSYIGDCYEAQSNYLAAIREYQTWGILVGQDNVRLSASYDALRQACEVQGGLAYFRKWMELIRADRALPDDQQLFADTDISGYYARLGENAKALDEIEKHFDESPTWCKIKYEPLYDTLHDEPRYKALVKRAGLEP
jgi:serine/threonine protein kinase